MSGQAEVDQAQAEQDATGATSPAVRSVSITVPVMDVPNADGTHGGRFVEVRFDIEQARTFKRMFHALRDSGAKLNCGGNVHDYPGAIRWLVDQIANQMNADTSGVEQ